MSAFDNIALPGRIPTSGAGASMVSPESLFRNEKERAVYEKLVSGVKGGSKEFNVGKVRVEIFDLSDGKQRRKYEKLWAELLMKVYRMEAVVESSKDLVRRADGTSYWMKYVEYVEFVNTDGKKSKGGKDER